MHLLTTEYLMAVFLFIFFFTSRLLFTNDTLHCAQSSSRYVSHSHEFHLNVTSENSKELLCVYMGI